MRARALFEKDSWVASRRPRLHVCIAVGLAALSLACCGYGGVAPAGPGSRLATSYTLSPSEDRSSTAASAVRQAPPEVAASAARSPGARREIVYGGLAMAGASFVTAGVYVGIVGLKVQQAQRMGFWNRCLGAAGWDADCPHLLQLQRDTRLLIDAAIGFAIGGMGFAHAALVYALIADGAFSWNKLRVLPVAGSDKGGLFLEGAF